MDAAARCNVCKRVLTDPVSIGRGAGDKCYKSLFPGSGRKGKKTRKGKKRKGRKGKKQLIKEWEQGEFLFPESKGEEPTCQH